jgi:protein ImuB
MFACLYVPDFPVQAALRCEPEPRRELLHQSCVVIVDGPASLLRVIAANPPARRAGIEIGMTKLQAESCGAAVARKRDTQNENAAQAALLDCARAFSPRVESTAPGTVILDLEGTERLFGSLERTASLIEQQSNNFSFVLNVAVASNPDAALYAARGWDGVTVIPKGEEAKRLAVLPIDVLSPSPEILDTLAAWGIRNLGALAELPPIPIVERLGQEGLRLQKLSRGETVRTLIPAEPTQDFVENFEFDDPVETVESLAFILNRLLQQLCMRLMARSLATNEFRLKLELEVHQVQPQICKDAEVYERVWKLPLPMTDAKVLMRLARLDLDACSFSAPIKKLVVEAVPAKPRSSQSGLFSPVSPQAEQLEITLARIRGIVGGKDESGVACVGSPRVLDSHKPGSFAVDAFSTELAASGIPDTEKPALPLRMFRPAFETSVELVNEKPNSVQLGKRTVHVLAASGPWVSSGRWWKQLSAWVREEWEVAVKMSDGIGRYRIYFDRLRKQWFIEGMFD